MSTMNVSLPDKLKAFAEGQVDCGQYGSKSECVRELIRCDNWQPTTSTPPSATTGDKLESRWRATSQHGWRRPTETAGPISATP